MINNGTSCMEFWQILTNDAVKVIIEAIITTQRTDLHYFFM